MTAIRKDKDFKWKKGFALQKFQASLLNVEFNV